MSLYLVLVFERIWYSGCWPQKKFLSVSHPSGSRLDWRGKPTFNLKIIHNKKVLLRERKRPTARRMACTRFADPGRGGGGSTYLGHPLRQDKVTPEPGQGIPPAKTGYPPTSRPGQAILAFIFIIIPHLKTYMRTGCNGEVKFYFFDKRLQCV